MCCGAKRRANCARHFDRDNDEYYHHRPIVIKTPLSMLIQYIIDSRAQKRAAQNASAAIHEPVFEIKAQTYQKPQEVQRLETVQEFLGWNEELDEKREVRTEEKRRESVVTTAVLPRYSQVLRE